MHVILRDLAPEILRVALESMNIANPIPSTVSGVSFTFLTADDVRRISVKQIVNPVLLDDLNRPNAGGLYDPTLGPSDPKDICATCRLGFFQCPGHFGHIELSTPVYHPLFMVNAYNLLRSMCQFCHKFKAKFTTVSKYAAKLALLEHGLLDAANGLDDLYQRTKPKQKTDKKDEEKKNEEKDEDESDEDFVTRIKLYQKVHLYRASSSKRDDYKDVLVYQTRKEVITNFLRSSITKSCQNCNAPGYTYRKDGHTKIIEYDLTAKQKVYISQSRLVRPNVLALSQKRSTPLEPEGRSSLTSDESEGDEIDAGENVFTDGEDEDDGKVRLSGAGDGGIKTKKSRKERFMTPEECRAALHRLFKKESVMCSLLYGRHGPFAQVTHDGMVRASADIFFMDVVPVAPTRFRPPAKLGDTLFEHPQNELLSKLLRTTYRLRDLNQELHAASTKKAQEDDMGAGRMKLFGTLVEALIQLQIDVNSFVDSGKNPTLVRQGKLPPSGIKQDLEKKDGLFRMHMMGKRVNYAARSVISPDVNIEPNEIGIPPVFARKLTYPEPVTQHNFRLMRDLVIRGPREYPGATMVEYEDGHMQYLEKLTLEQRTAVANQLLTPQEGTKAATMVHGLTTRTMAANKKVHRHLRDGDILLLNRQPTLHKPSMMAHKAHVLQGEKTIRMHYANCNSYNADFDGDGESSETIPSHDDIIRTEMNIHFPQNEVARAEAYFIANTDNQYLVPTSGKPLRGLIQDHVVAGLWMTNKSTFFSREEYYQLLYGSLRPEDDGYASSGIITLPPAIWKPIPLWTGKQIISTILRNITPDTASGLNLRSKSQISSSLFGKEAQEEGEVFILAGELMCGILDKSQVGASQYGLVHSVYELYGADTAGRLLGILSRLFTKFLQHRAFTCRMDDLILTDEGNRQRKKLRQDGQTLGTDAVVDNFPTLRDVPSSEVPGTLRSLLEDVLFDDQKMADLDRNAQNKMNKHTRSITDACIPNGLYRKFPANHMQAMTLSGAKGSATNAQLISCGLGQQSLEGRRVPVMVSGKTLPSFKAFETAAIAGGYVGSRFLTGIRPQEFYFHCMAGREGLIDTAVKTSRSGYLQRCLIKHLEGIRVHYDHTIRGSDSSVYQFQYGGDGIDVTKQKHLFQFEFAIRNEDSLINRVRPKALVGLVDDNLAVSHMKKILKKSENESRALEKTFKYPPTLSLYSPSLFLGSTSEKFARAVNSYIKLNPDKLMIAKKNVTPEDTELRGKRLISHRNFQLLMNVWYMKSLVEPGEAVGLLASQGIGEPSTQMTLNTFHLAGHGAANVTLGIPRLREIVMTASRKPKTPNMTLEVLEGAVANDVERFCKHARRLTLSQVVDNVVVKERLCLKHDIRTKEYTVVIRFYPAHEYREEYHVSPREILACFFPRFANILRKEVLLELKKLETDLKTQSSNVGKGQTMENSGPSEDDEEVEESPIHNDKESEVGDGDADETKRARQSKQQSTYDDDDDEDVSDDENGCRSDGRATEGAYDDPVSDHSSEAEQSEDDNAESLDDQLENVKQLFLKSVKMAKTFSFSDSECSFVLEYGSDMPKLLLVGIIERTCVKTVIREIPDIKDCFLVTDDKKNGGKPSRKLITAGSNFPGMWNHAGAVANLNSIYSNDIYAALRTYGVEMARSCIVREIREVFKAYSISVDDRHLELISDYMTFDGGYNPFNRKGISSNSSPLLKASFETTASFISDAALYGDFDNLSTPSGSIVLGRPSTSGTASFGIVLSTT